MSEALKERKEMDPQYQWDLTKMYASDAEWEKAFAAIDPKIEALAAWEGKLNNAASIREFMMQKSACSVNWKTWLSTPACV